jgi:aldose 1-epimerase
MQPASNDPQEKIFGTLPNGQIIKSYTLSNKSGLEVTVITYGATITSLKVPSKNGLKDVVLGFDTIEDYIESHTLPAPPYFGAVVGRYSGRIKNGKFTIDGKQYQLNSNNGTNTLHGGNHGFDRVVWQVDSISETSLTLSYTSPDGEEHFPGELKVQVTYTLTNENEVIIDYKATTSAATIINLTQHSYFNMDGHEDNVLEQDLKVNATTLLEIDNANIPSGRIIKASTKGFDFSTGGKCPAKIDDSFVLRDTASPAATLYSKHSGIQLTVTSNQPSVHSYVGGNCFGRIKGKGGVEYHEHSGICFESQNYPDAPNHDHFPNAILREGDSYNQKTIWKFDVLQ